MMYLKLIGAGLVVMGCGGFGFYMAHRHRREERTLRELIGILDFMECELQYRLTPLPDLCRLAAGESHGILRCVFLSLTNELEDKLQPDVHQCMISALIKTKDIPKLTYDSLLLLGRSLGRFDIHGQLAGLESVRQHCRMTADNLSRNQESRLRSYQTLGLCAGAAMAILFL